MTDEGSRQQVKLAHVLLKAGFAKNQIVELSIDAGAGRGRVLTLRPASQASFTG
jgi:hypothetical protein